VASFSFGAGNAAKLARLPLYAAGRLATLLIPRSRGDEWVFGCAVGIADGALALWQVARDHGHPSVWLVATPQQERDAAALGIPSIPKHSLRGFWRTARARVVVVTHGFGDVNRYAVTGAFVVQLWHGIPLKRIGLDSAETLRPPAMLGHGILSSLARRVLGIAYRRTARRIGVLPAASHVARGRLESAFGLPDEHVPMTGEPRVDVLSQGSAQGRRADARERIDAAAGPLDAASRLVLYAPTWRDGEPDPAVPSDSEWRAILDVLERRDAVLLLRSHPLGAGDYRPPVVTERVRSLGSDVVADVTPLLSGIDALVTDYSSLIFDSSLVPLPVVFLAPDVDAYARRRGFYGTYAEVAGDDVVVDWAGAAARLDALLGDDAVRDAALERARRLDERVHAHRDGDNTTRVYRAILAGLGREKGTA